MGDHFRARYFADTVSGSTVQLRIDPVPMADPSATRGIIPIQINMVLNGSFDCGFYKAVGSGQKYVVYVTTPT